MSTREEVAPSTVGVELQDGGIAVAYLDGRTDFYHGIPEAVEGTLQTAPGKDVHVLVTDDTETEGVLVYVNERSTEAEILEDTGVGRVMLSKGETASAFPGVEVTRTGFRCEVEADLDAVDGRVFVFEEDEMGERSYEIVASE